jgi:hypothetical protein
MKAKPIIILIVTLALGFLLGMLVSARIRYNRLKPVRVFFSEQRFRDGFYSIIQPDDRQKMTIDDLLTKYGKVNSTIQGDFRRRLDSTMKEFWNELDPVLTKEQRDRLKEMEQRRNEMIRENLRNRHDSVNFRDRGRRGMPPPPGGERGPRPPSRNDRDSSELKQDIK